MGILQASGLPFPTPGDLPDPKIKLAFPALAGRFFTASTTWEAQPILYPFSIVFGFFFFPLVIFYHINIAYLFLCLSFISLTVFLKSGSTTSFINK